MMRGWFGSIRSFAAKVTLLMTLTSGVAIVAVSFTLASLDYYNRRHETLAALNSQTAIVAMNSSAPLAFNDRSAANEALAAFQSMPDLASASLYDTSGNLFAKYRRREGPAPESAAELGPFGANWHAQRMPIAEKGQRLGALEVIYDLSGLQEHLWRVLGFSLLISAVAVALVFLFSLRIRRLLIRPIALLGETARVVSQTRDYTQRTPKVSDDELGAFTDTFNGMLEQIHKQDLEIQTSRADALRANQLKDEFLATLSHELRTPMAPIVGWAQILRMSAGDQNKVLQAAAVIERNARAQNKIIDDLLDMSRIVSGKVKLELRELDLADVVGEAIDIVAPSAAAKTIALERDVAPGVAVLRADPHRLQQVVWNLLSNAIKFTPAGGSVRVALRREPGHVRLSVSDSGQGIPAEFLPHVFERFRQADSTSTRQYSGLGLGLAIVKQLVELHGGSVAAESDGAEKGATFVVTLPLAAGDAQTPALADSHTPASAPVDEQYPLRDIRVLLVDDERDTRDLLEQVLALAGADVRACASAPAALVAFEDFQPQALISDIAMPEMSGHDLIRRVRAMPAPLCDVPAIALTAFARPDDRERALQAGFQKHLAKPVDNTILIATVLAIVRNRRAPAQV
jgi:signal transduction histidine kinase/CheY-like chemotaxis protein